MTHVKGTLLGVSAVPLFPVGQPVPSSFKTSEFLLRPLRAVDVALDYDAVMSSKALLRQWSQRSWPSDTFTLTDNLKDLQRHEAEHVERKAFTFTVMDVLEAQCLGCVYIKPLHPALDVAQVCPAQSANKIYAADVSFWVRQSRLVDELDARVLSSLREWFRCEWPFTCVVFHANEYNVRQRTLFQDAGLQTRHTVVTDGVHWFVFG